MLRFLRQLLAGAIPAFVLAACLSPRATEVPIPSKFYAGTSDDKSTLIIFLPGRGDDIDSYERGGFIDILRASRRGLDAVVVDSHLGYYIQRNLAERLRDDVISPYREKGYERFIVVGISLGAVGALRLNVDFPEEIMGTVVIAPFLGSNAMVETVREAGGVRAWSRTVQEPLEPEQEIWSWINTMVGTDNDRIPCTILAYGRGDKFAQAGNYFAEYLPESHVFTAEGAHKWTVWTPLWAEITASDSWQSLGCTP